MTTIPRLALPATQVGLASAAAVVLLGPRQVGKTTLAQRIAADLRDAAIYLDLERAADLRRLDDADTFLRAQAGKLVVIDEIHRSPELFPTLRGVIDEGRRQGFRRGQFLILGSASLDLMRQSSESLAGRIAYQEILPISVDEAADAGYGFEQLWIRGGFPESLTAKDDKVSFEWRASFIRSYLERDVPMFAPRLPAQTIGRLWRMLANDQGGMLNRSRLASSLEVTVPTIGKYVDLLVDLMLVRRLRPWFSNEGKRLVKTPKVYVRDSGVLHALVDIESWNDVLGHSILGPSWEGFANENLINAAGDRCRPYFYRTHDGAEIDLILERAGKPWMAIEIKRSSAPKISKSFVPTCDELGIEKRYLVYSGEGQYPARGGVTVTPLLDLVRELRGLRS